MRKFIAATLLIVVAIETLFANRWLVATGPLTDESSIAERLLQESPTPRVYRSEPDGWMPAELLAADRSQALTVARNWERATLLPKYHLDFRISMAKAPCSIEPADRAVVWMLAREAGPVRPDGQREPAPALLHSLGVEWVISPGWSPLLGDQPPLPCPDPPSNAVIQAIPDPLPRAWIVRNLRVEDELPDLAPGPLLQRTRDCFFSQTDTRDLRKGAIVETDNRQVRTQLNTIQPGSAENDQVSWTQSRSDQIQVEVKTTAAGLLILRDGYAPDWQALIVSSDGTKSEGTVIRVNRVMRGLFLPAGEHTVILTYWPRSLMWGLWLSGISWLLSGGVWWKLRLDDRKHTDSSAFTVARSARLIKNRRRPHSPLAVFTL